MTPYNFITGLRVHRHYQPEPLADADLDAVLEAARWTGSAKNHQSWSFVVVTGDDLQKLAECGDFTDPVRRSAATVVIVQEPGGYEFDTGRAAQSMMLAAKARGVASCPVTFHRHADAGRLLGVPEEARCRYGVTLGYPAEGPPSGPPGGRKPLAELVRRQGY